MGSGGENKVSVGAARELEGSTGKREELRKRKKGAFFFGGSRRGRALGPLRQVGSEVLREGQ